MSKIAAARKALKAAKEMGYSRARVKAFPAVPPRDFALDYPDGRHRIYGDHQAAADGSRLTHDMDGRPIGNGLIAGRRVVGGEETPLSQAELDALTESLTRGPVESVARQKIGRASGSAEKVVGPDGEVRYPIAIADDLAEKDAREVQAHEVGHVIDWLTPPLRSNGIRRALEQNYSTGEEGVVKTKRLTLPKHMGYSKGEEDAELVAEALRAYLTNPGYIKKHHSELAARLREMVNESPLRDKIILNSVPIAGGVAFAMGAGEDAEAAPIRPALAAARKALRAGDDLGYSRDHSRGLVKYGSEGMTPEARLARARELGFDHDIYHATGADIRAIDPAQRGSTTDVGAAREAFWAASTPEGTQGYADLIQRRGGDPNVIRGRGRLTNPKVIDGGGKAIYDAVPDRAFSAVLRDAKAAGHDGVVFRNVRDAPGNINNAPVNDVFAFFRPDAVRSTQATFDPAKSASRNLLAAVPIAAGGAALAAGGGEAQAAETNPFDDLDDLETSASGGNPFDDLDEPPPPTPPAAPQAPSASQPPPSQKPAPAAPPAAEGFLERERRRSSDRSAALLNSLTGNFSDEILGGVVGAGSAGIAALRGRDPQAAYDQDYRKTVDRERATIDRARREQPILTTINDVAVGGLVGGAGAKAVGAAAKGLGLAARSAPGLAGRIAAGSGVGATAGAVSGYGAGTDAQSRQQNALTGAAIGGAIGGALPGAVAAGRGLLNAFGSAARDTARGLQRTFGVDATPNPARDPGAVRLIDRLRREGGLSIDDLEKRLDEAAANPQGRVLAQALGQRGLSKAKSIVETPGRTADLAAPRLREAARGQLQRLSDALDQATTTQTRRTALNALAQEYERTSRELYAPILRQGQVDQAGAQAAEEVISLLPERIKQRVQQAAQIVAAGEGRQPAQLNPAEMLHYTKVGLDDAIAELKQQGLQGAQLRGLVQLKERYLQALDQAVPGYAQARKAWAGSASAEDALTTGQKVFSERADDLEAYVAGLNDAERQFFRTGVRDAVEQLANRADRDGYRNVSNVLLDSRKRNVIRAALGPEDADKFDRALQSADESFRERAALEPGRGSQTFRLFQEAEEAVPTSRSALAQAGVRALGRVTVGPLRQERRNAFGAALFEPIDSGLQEFNPDRVRALREALRRQARLRDDRFNSAVGSGAGFGVGAHELAEPE